MSCKKRGTRPPAKYAHLEAPELLRIWRLRAGLDQQGAANELGIDTATYNAFERGRKRPGIDIAMRIQLRTRSRVGLAHWADPRKAELPSEVAA